MAYQYDGSIIVRKVLKANLPSGRVAGNVWYFVVENEDDLVGEIWATNANGYLVNYSSSADLTELQKQINVLSGKVNNLADNIYNGDEVFSDLPMGRSLFLSTVTFGGKTSGNVLIEKTRWYAKETLTNGANEQFYRIINNGANATWSEWKQISTSSKTSFNIVPQSNKVVLLSKCYVINNTVEVYLKMKMSDDTAFATGAIVIGKMPDGTYDTSVVRRVPCSCSGYTSDVWNGLISSPIVATISGADIIVCPSVSTAKILHIKARYTL